MEYLYSLCDWVKASLAWIGWGKIEANILLLGIDNAGKTTLLHFLKYGSLKQSPPTRNPTMEELQMEGITFKAYDLGGEYYRLLRFSVNFADRLFLTFVLGNVNERPLWSTYFPLVNGVVFLVDISDIDRIAEAKDALHQLFAVDQLNDVPFLILANKIDLPTALSPREVQRKLELDGVLYSRKIHIAMVSIVMRQGIKEGIQWLGQQLKA